MSGPKVIYDFTPHNLPPELLQAIGLAIVSGSHTENVLDTAVGGALGIESDLMMALTSHMSVPLKVGVLKSAAEFRLEADDLDELDLLLEQINQAAGRRNGYAHDGWYMNPAEGRPYRVKQQSRVRLEVSLIPVSVEDIKADALFIYQAGLALSAFIEDRDLLPPIPTSPKPREHKSPAARKARRKAGIKH